jgi:hypothetical protein
MLCKKTPDLSSSEAARELLRNFAFFVGETTGKQLVPSARLFDIWANALQDLPAEQIHAAGERLLRTWRFPNLPTPGDVRAQLDLAGETGFKLEIEEAWQLAMKWCVRYAHGGSIVGHDEKGRRIYEQVPSLPAAHVSAIRAAGGARYLESCPPDELPWAKKAFVAHFKTIHETGQVEHLLAEGDAKKIWRKLCAGPNTESKSLPRSPDEPPADPPSRDEVRTALKKVTKPSPEELKEKCIRVQAQVLQMERNGEAAVREYMLKHGLSADTKPSSAVIDIHPKYSGVSKGASPDPKTNDFATSEVQAR